ncbi:unnamed protein product (macronuclear) [Paramecium tetraurelia]|uniref:Uncharacterized protein n=1 Tax=Paramecium tetraurelia TaxID=5888 RepID=A0DU30_PARTE|nr:uncharacterized protein GSPATT00039773001 [Paramecium tetraurelia]CAK86547.1 unnamed protein product [Paramecium tetraurelia]|eukprot:XP_001453944.1 hypothetical protein (macronuclear) [Paramecium tetraurelia strain d4-2]
MKFLKKADFFGVPFVQNIDHQQTKFQSVTGGILTIAIFVLSLSYTFWVAYLWKTNQMNPKISHEHYVSDYSLLDLSEDIMIIKLIHLQIIFYCHQWFTLKTIH